MVQYHSLMLVNNMHDPSYVRVAPYTFVLATRPKPKPPKPLPSDYDDDMPF